MGCYIVTRSCGDSALEPPRDGKPFVRKVRAERAGLDSGGEKSPEVAVLLGDSLQCRTNRPGYRGAGAFRTGSCPAVTAAETDGATDLVHERFLLVFRFRDIFLVAEFARFFKFVLKLGQSALIVGLRLRIEHLACVAEVAGDRSGSREVFGTRGIRAFFTCAA